MSEPTILTRECDCPPDVIRCAHLDGRVIRLRTKVGEPLPRGATYRAPPRFFAAEDDALAAFHEAEVRLLWGGA